MSQQKFASPQDPYQVLGIAPNATEKEVALAFRKKHRALGDPNRAELTTEEFGRISNSKSELNLARQQVLDNRHSVDEDGKTQNKKRREKKYLDEFWAGLRSQHPHRQTATSTRASYDWRIPNHEPPIDNTITEQPRVRERSTPFIKRQANMWTLFRPESDGVAASTAVTNQPQKEQEQPKEKGLEETILAATQSRQDGIWTVRTTIHPDEKGDGRETTFAVVRSGRKICIYATLGEFLPDGVKTPIQLGKQAREITGNTLVPISLLQDENSLKLPGMESARNEILQFVNLRGTRAGENREASKERFR